MIQTDIRISSVLAPRLEKSTSAKVDNMLSSITTPNTIEYIPMFTLVQTLKHFTEYILPQITHKVLLFLLISYIFLLNFGAKRG